jgi:hypothetical protein
MLKHLTIVAEFLFFSLSVAVSQPKVNIENGKQINFGDVFIGQPITHLVMVRNTGRDTLHIEDVKAQCGCTTPVMPAKVIPPHDSSEMKITFNSANYKPGMVTKHVYLRTNDTTGGGTYTLEFVATVVSGLTLSPGYFTFPNAKLDTTFTKTITIMNTFKQPITIESIDIPDKAHTKDFTFTLSKKTIAPRDSTILQADFHPKSGGSVQGKIILNTDNPLQKTIEVTYLTWVNRK